MGKAAPESTIRIPKAKKQESLRELLANDEDFRFLRIKLGDGKNPRYVIPAPTADDEDNVESVKSFRAVVVVARKNYYRSEEDKKEGREGKEKRALYILREGKVVPELFYVSPTGVRNWKHVLKSIVNEYDTSYWGCLIEFSGEHVDGRQYSWNKPKFEVVRPLNDDEMEWVSDLHEMVDGRVKVYEDESDLDDIEDEALGINKSRSESPEEKYPKGVKRSLEDDDEDEDKLPKARDKKPKEDDEAQRGSRNKDKKSKDDDDDDPTPKSKGRAGYPSLDDDDDDDEAVTSRNGKGKGKSDDDDDDDD